MVRVRGCDGFCSFVSIDYMLSLYGSGCVSFGMCTNTIGLKKLVLVEGMRKYDGPWQGQGFIKWVLWEGVHKYDGLLEGEGFIQWVGPTSVFCVLKFGHGMVC